MARLFDYLKYNNIPYYELTDEYGKDKLERFVKKVEEKELDKIILSFTDRTFNAREFPEFPHDFVSSFPEDLTNKMMSIFVHLDDK